MKKIKILPSRIHGKGMFADEDIQKGERIQYLRGSKTKLIIRSKKDSNSIEHWIGAGKHSWFNTHGTPFRYINHSCDANAAITGTKTLVGLRNIKKGEEIYIDYSMTDADPFMNIACKCGSSNCRGQIRAIYTVPTSVFSKHMPHVPKNFQRLYLRNYIQSKIHSYHKRGGKARANA
jgi:hypothetical protein